MNEKTEKKNTKLKNPKIQKQMAAESKKWNAREKYEKKPADGYSVETSQTASVGHNSTQQTGRHATKNRHETETHSYICTFTSNYFSHSREFHYTLYEGSLKIL